MSHTKNIIIGVVGTFITIYVALIGLNIYALQIHKNKLEHAVSRAVENTLEDMFRSSDISKAEKQLEEDIKTGSTKDADITFTINEIDLEKGILSVTVTEEFPFITGTTKSIVVEKAAIMEQIVPEEKVTITFMVEGEIYKEYQLVKGESCPIPKPPPGLFRGWAEYGNENSKPVEKIGLVWEDKVFFAITE